MTGGKKPKTGGKAAERLYKDRRLALGGMARRRTVVRGLSRGKERQKEKFRQKTRGWGHAGESKRRRKKDWR
jgi:hypothetical protein